MIQIDYRNDKKLRDSFNELAVKVFGLNFENWYQNGFWQDNYIPYSVVIDGKVISNISVNRCDVNYRGEIRRLIQLGTVMTDPDFRGKGYSRLLMEKILSDYEDKVDGIYLFANDSVVDFYPKFGFVKGRETRFCKEVEVTSKNTAVQVPMSGKEDWDKMVRLFLEKDQNAAMYMVGNPGLYMFYLSQFMQENVFYISGCDTYVIAEADGDMLTLFAVIGNGDIDQVISSFGSKIKKVVLDFTPKDTSLYDKSEVHEEDTTLFVRGNFFEKTKEDEYMFQSITHA